MDVLHLVKLFSFWGQPYFNHISTCGNVICCPVCGPRIMARRAGEIKKAGESWFLEDKENTCYMISLTCSHDFAFTLDNFIKSIKSVG